MIAGISGKIKAKAALIDPDRYGRSDTSRDRPLVLGNRQGPAAAGRVLIGIGLIAVAAASPAAAHRYSGGSVTIPELYYFWRQLMWIAVGVPVMIGISMMTARARPASCRCSAPPSSSCC